MIEKKLIGIAGKAGTGKSEVSRILEEKGYASVAFADIIKRILKDTFKFTDEQLFGPSSNRNEPDPRYIRQDGEPLTTRFCCQKFGEVGRLCYPDVWVDYTMCIVDSLLKSDKFKYTVENGLYSVAKNQAPIKGVVVSDVRFLSEAKAIKDRGGKLILLKRLTSLSGEAAQDASENGLPDNDYFYDYIIDNTGDLEALRGAVLGVCLTGHPLVYL